METLMSILPILTFDHLNFGHQVLHHFNHPSLKTDQNPEDVEKKNDEESPEKGRKSKQTKRKFKIDLMPPQNNKRVRRRTNSEPTTQKSKQTKRKLGIDDTDLMPPQNNKRVRRRTNSEPTTLNEKREIERLKLGRLNEDKPSGLKTSLHGTIYQVTI